MSFDENLNTVVEDNDSDYEEQAKVGDEDASSKKRKERFLDKLNLATDLHCL